MLIALAASSALQHNLSLIVSGHIRDHLAGFCFHDNSSFRNFQYNIRPVRAVTASFAALLSVLGLEFSFVAVISQSRLAFIHFKDNVSASSAVAAVGTAVGNIKFSPEAYMAVAAFTGTDDDSRSVCKHSKLLF